MELSNGSRYHAVRKLCIVIQLREKLRLHGRIALRVSVVQEDEKMKREKKKEYAETTRLCVAWNTGAVPMWLSHEAENNVGLRYARAFKRAFSVILSRHDLISFIKYQRDN